MDYEYQALMAELEGKERPPAPAAAPAGPPPSAAAAASAPQPGGGLLPAPPGGALLYNPQGPPGAAQMTQWAAPWAAVRLWLLPCTVVAFSALSALT
jgi:hypothetical protein